RRTASSSLPDFAGAAPRSAVPIRCHRRHHKSRASANPPNQTARRLGNTVPKILPEAAAVAPAWLGFTDTKGSLTCCIAEANTGAVCTLCDPSWLPIATNNANGIRNFKDAASQSAYRTWARLFLSTSVTSAKTTANKVDCHRWFARGAL